MARSKILRDNARYHQQVDTLLQEASRYDDDALNRKPADGGWSAMQTLHHLLLSERNSLLYVQKKLSFNTAIEKAGLSAGVRSLLLRVFLKLPFKFKAPPTISKEFLPDYATLADTRAQWDILRQGWTDYLENLPSEMLNKAAYRHPRAGRLHWTHMLTFFRDHATRHTKQIRRALKNSK